MAKKLGSVYDPIKVEAATREKFCSYLLNYYGYRMHFERSEAHNARTETVRILATVTADAYEEMVQYLRRIKFV